MPSGRMPLTALERMLYIALVILPILQSPVGAVRGKIDAFPRSDLRTFAALPRHIFKLILIKVGAVYQTVGRKVRLLNLAPCSKELASQRASTARPVQSTAGLNFQFAEYISKWMVRSGVIHQSAALGTEKLPFSTKIGIRTTIFGGTFSLRERLPEIATGSCTLERPQSPPIG